MKYTKILRYKPWLKMVHIGNINDRLQKATHGNAFIFYNTIQHNYELHTLEALELTGDSYNTSFDTTLVNQFIIHDYRANDFKMYQEEVESERLARNNLFEKHEQTKHDLDSMLKIVERTLGTKV